MLSGKCPQCKNIMPSMFGKFGKYYRCYSCNKNYNAKIIEGNNYKQQQQPTITAEKLNHHKNILNWFIANDEHKAILKAYQETKDHLLISAYAGSGKTTVSEWIIANSPQESFYYCAFNTKIVREFESFLPKNATASTINSLFYRPILRDKRFKGIKIDSSKVYKLTKINTEKIFGDYKSLENEDKKLFNGQVKFITAVIEKIKQYSVLTVDENFINSICETYDINNTDMLFDLKTAYLQIETVLKESDNSKVLMDFNDQIRYPFLYGIMPNIEGTLIVDESQDLNAIQIHMLSLLKNRIIFVGDSRQAIYFFRGALSNCFDVIREVYNPIDLTLSKTRRVPKIVCETYLKPIVPNIESLSAVVGSIGNIEETHFLELMKQTKETKNKFVLCRLNAPLTKFAMQCLANDLPAVVLGSDIGRGLIKIVSDVQRIEPDYYYFFEELENNRIETVNKLNSKMDFTQAEIYNDKINAIINISSDNKIKNYDDLIKQIENLFDDKTQETKITFSSIHKAKGLETKDLYVLYPHLMPFVPKNGNVSEEQMVQEENLIYVCYSRTLENVTTIYEVKKEG